ncbi:beta-fructofuranosidase [Paenibacillus sp. UNCCL117]|uniref:glycoside hydrolase family 32 protein n=1 Tax=unclassified Paenibacillus TaxID=185978 RepID=UPI00088D7217|nr:MULTISPECIES: glycoside hydrolase family 32 protein [unclassified Paenibacillus]SDE19380.1 beta-fructofuranosidase [Paenibacillus sp. cl123]SFW62023.1 beta-fructofuranosidase [Paenibacillus sp. UNCCL117]
MNVNDRVQDHREPSSTHRNRVEEANRALAELAGAIPGDGYRLHYHLMPPAGWMNDPNGLVHFQGEYHVFYQHYPYMPKHGPMYWGHAKSRDLVHWEHLPIALAPSEAYDLGQEGGYGCWSGSAVDDEGVLTLIYTGHVDGRSPEEAQCIATSTDGVHFEKWEHNPAISGPPAAGGFGFRDPKVWKHDGVWYMIVGHGMDGQGQALLYASADLRQWTYKGIAADSDGTMGNMWECPDLFPLGTESVGKAGDGHVLIMSPMNMGATKTMYLTGNMDYKAGKFRYEYAERLDYGFDFYAPQTFLDDQGRRILIGWMNIWGASMPEQAEGWMGAFTLPRELKLNDDGRLRMVPVAELKALRGSHAGLQERYVAAGSLVDIPELAGDALELIAVFDAGDLSAAAEFGIQVRCSADGREFTEIVYHTAERKLRVDRSRSGQGDGGVSEAELELLEDGRLKLHLFVDRSSVELFANDGLKTMTNRIYPQLESLGVKIFARNANVRLQSLDGWLLRSVTA